MTNKSKLFEKTSFEDIKQVVMEIKKEGYKVFEYKVNPKMINKLKSLSYTLKAKVGDSQIVFDPKKSFNACVEPEA